MKSIVLLILLTTATAFAQNSAHHPEDHFHQLPAGGRRALHGMVLFGAGPYFLEHIPMLTPPHDFQIITEVSLKNRNGKPVTLDFSQQGFTLKPDSNFSLNDYVAGRLGPFSASIFQGSFEQEEKLIKGLEGVSVEIKSYRLIRQLPSPSNERFIQLSDGKNVFESVVITPAQNFQKIFNAKTGKILWCVKAPDFFESCP